MRALIQRVKHAKVDVGATTTGEIGRGLLIFLGVHDEDTDATLDWMVNKCAQLRIFADDEGKMNKSVLDLNGEILVVSQFTLYGNCHKGNRPSYVAAAHPSKAEPMYDLFCKKMSERLGKAVQTGKFGADMQVSLVNDGPVTLWIDR